jgi:lysophospholipase L1-like esterase
MASEQPDLVRLGNADLSESPDLPPQISGPTRYPAGILHSALSSAVVDRLSLVLSSGSERPEVFAKVGDSITVDTHFLNCFAGNDIMLSSSASDEPTRQYFAATDLGGTTSFDRVSLAAGVGWHASTELTGSPPPLPQEIAAISPGFAVVMLGTNDTDPCCVESFATNLTSVVDTLLGKGVVPLLSTIPPRGDSTTANALVPEMNAAIRAVAQHRQIPYMDFWQTLINLPSYGLGPDGIHPAAYPSHSCWLTDPALQYGVNQRNKIVLDALDRAKRAIVDGSLTESPPPPLAGSGTFGDPFVVDALPFVDSNDTTTSTSSVADVYSCAPQNESGPEIVYRVDVTQAMTLRARVFVDSGVDIDVMWLSAPDKNSCIARNDKVVDLQAQPGTYWLSCDTFVSSTGPKPGAYRLTIVPLP